MMKNTSLDFYGVEFWLLVGLGIFFVGGLTRAKARAWGVAALNLTALSFLLGIQVVLVIASLVAVWLVLKMLAMRRVQGLLLFVGGLGVLGVFLIHKRPEFLLSWKLPGTLGFLRLLAVVGFSYVALRLVDVARAVVDGRPAPDLAATINYLVPFHMLAAGPIQSYDDFLAQPAVPQTPGFALSLEALEWIASGLFKKYVLANTLQALFLTNYASVGWYNFLEIQFSYVWLYLDFSAYSEVALGAGLLMGVSTPVNFRRPYLARNLIDYWERWHITLSEFIRRHVFIPIQLALMRRTDAARPLWSASVAFSVSFLLCGLWHSVGPRWLLWGGLHAFGLVVCNLYKARLLRKLGRKGFNRYLQNPWIRMLCIVATFEYAALALAAATYPFHRLPWWSNYPG
jgi:D-alanyl-lipoteichoic acid acyltransferase DltB (MBOAT superfamily)